MSMNKSDARYYDRIDGRRIIAGKIVRLVADRRRIRCHACRVYGKVYWTADSIGVISWSPTIREALEKALANGHIDEVA